MIFIYLLVLTTFYTRKWNNKSGPVNTHMAGTLRVVVPIDKRQIFQQTFARPRHRKSPAMAQNRQVPASRLRVGANLLFSKTRQRTQNPD